MVPLEIKPQDGLLVQFEHGMAVCQEIAPGVYDWEAFGERGRIGGALSWSQVRQALGQPVKVIEPEPG